MGVGVVVTTNSIPCPAGVPQVPPSAPAARAVISTVGTSSRLEPPRFVHGATSDGALAVVCSCSFIGVLLPHRRLFSARHRLPSWLCPLRRRAGGGIGPPQPPPPARA